MHRVTKLGALWRRLGSLFNPPAVLIPERDAPGASPRETRLDVLVGAVVLIVYGATLFVLREGPLRYDSAIYWNAAVDPQHVPNVFTLRIGLVLPVHAAVRLFGPSEAALYAVPFAAGLALTGAVYATMLVLFRDRVLAALAALLTSLNANVLLFSSFLYPDILATATFTGGILCLLLGRKRSSAGEGHRYAGAFALCAGALFGWTYLIREFSPLLLLPAVAGAVVLLRYPPRRFLLLCAGAVAVVSIEIVYGAVRFGEPFIHAERLFGRREASVTDRFAPRVEHIQAQLNNLFDTAIVFPRLLFAWGTGWIFLLLTAIFLLALVSVRDRRLWLLGIWFLSFWAVMAVIGLGSLPSGRWILNITNIRYWYPIFPPLAMGALGGLTLLLRHRSRAAWRTPAAYAVASLLTVLAVVPGAIEYRRCAANDIWPPADTLEGWHDVRAWFSTPEADSYDVVWADVNTARYLSAFTTTTFGTRVWTGRRKILRGEPRDLVEGSRSERAVLLLNKRFFAGQAVLDEFRRRWSPLFVSRDEMMIVLAPKSRAATSASTDRVWWKVPDFVANRAEATNCGLNPYWLKSWRR